MEEKNSTKSYKNEIKGQFPLCPKGKIIPIKIVTDTVVKSNDKTFNVIHIKY